MMNVNDFDDFQTLLEFLGEGGIVDFDAPVQYPIKQINIGSSASVYTTADDKILRVSEDLRDFDYNHIFDHSSLFPKIHNHGKINCASFMLRDDIPNLPDNYSVLNITDWISIPQFYHGKIKCLDEDEQKSTFPHIFRDIFYFVDDVKYLLPLFEAYSYMLITMDIFSKKFDVCLLEMLRCLEAETEMTGIEIVDGYGCVKNYTVHSVAIARRFVWMTEFIRKHQDKYAELMAYLDFQIRHMRELGVVASDSIPINLGLHNGELVFRDPYHVAFRHKDYQIKIGQHRLRKGLFVPPEWNPHPVRIEPVGILFRCGFSVGVPVLDECQNVYTPIKSSHFRERIFLTDGGVVLIQKSRDLAEIHEKLRLETPASVTVYSPTQENLFQTLELAGITETLPLDEYDVQDVTIQTIGFDMLLSHHIGKKDKNVVTAYKELSGIIACSGWTNEQKRAFFDACLTDMKEDDRHSLKTIKNGMCDEIQEMLFLLIDIHEKTGCFPLSSLGDDGQKIPVCDYNNGMFVFDGNVKFGILNFDDEDLPIIKQRLGVTQKYEMLHSHSI